jgi:hypothetical protein
MKRKRNKNLAKREFESYAYNGGLQACQSRGDCLDWGAQQFPVICSSFSPLKEFRTAPSFGRGGEGGNNTESLNGQRRKILNLRSLIKQLYRLSCLKA